MIRRFKPGDIVCEEGDFGSTAFYIIGGHVDIYIANPLASVKTRAGGSGIFSLFRKVSSVLGKNETGPGAYQGFIPIDASVDSEEYAAGLPRAESVWRDDLPPYSRGLRQASDRRMRDTEMLQVVLDMLVGTREVDIATKATSKEKAVARTPAGRL